MFPLSNSELYAVLTLAGIVIGALLPTAYPKQFALRPASDRSA